MQEDSGLYTVLVAVVGTARVTVHADDENEARVAAEGCITPMHVHTWTYVSDEVEVYPVEQPGQQSFGFDDATA